jgi:D-alanyl-D-alanine dipeptidase
MILQSARTVSLFFYLLTGVAANSAYSQSTTGRENFVHLKDVIPDVKYEIRYAGKNNFLGRPVKGYEGAEALLSKQAAAALAKVQK